MYLDPGFGSMLIQLLVAGFAVLGGLFFKFRTKIKAYFAKKKGTEAADDDTLEAQATPLAQDVQQKDESKAAEQQTAQDTAEHSEGQEG